MLRDQQDRLLNLRLLEEIEPDTFARKNTELRDRIAALTLQLESAHRGRDERADMAQRVFELSQSLTERWITAEYAAKRQILEMICLNFSLDGVSLVPEMRKPFDILVEGLSVSSSWGDSRRTFVNETLAFRLLAHFIPERTEFTGDAITELVERGKYANTRALRNAGRSENGTKRKAAVPGT